MASIAQKSHKKSYGTTEHLVAAVGFARPNHQDSDFPHSMPGQSHERCTGDCLGTVLEVITTVVFLGYSVFLIWLLAYLKGNLYYHLLNLIPFTLIVIPFILLCCVRNDRESFDKLLLRHLQLVSVVVTLMATFTMLTRLAYYLLSHDQTIGTNFVIVSLKANILVFLWYIAARKRFSLAEIRAEKDVITRVILDNVDIFNMIELLAVHSGLGIAEESSLEKAMQAFCSMSFVLVTSESAMGLILEKEKNSADEQDRRELRSNYIIQVQVSSLLLQNIPFFIIRLVMWGQYDLFNLGFLAKNGMAIVFGMADIISACRHFN